MPPKLRPRLQLAPSDHNYAKSLTHLPVYAENGWPVILSGPENIFQKIVVEPEEPAEESGDLLNDTEENGDQVPKRVKRSVSESALKDDSSLGPSKKKRRKFFKGTTFEPKRRRKRRISAQSVLTETTGGNSDVKTENSFNDSGIVSDLTESIRAELDQTTNSLKINPTELSLGDGSILLQPSADNSGASGLYNLSLAEDSISSTPTIATGTATFSNPGQPVKMKRICSTCSSKTRRRKQCQSLQLESYSRRQSERLIKMNYKFPFEDLPDVCKLKIFSYLSLTEKGTAAQVCIEWNRLMKAPGLWSHMNFSIFNPTGSPIKSKSSASFGNYFEYDSYKNRVSKFLDYMRFIKPKLCNLIFSYDIGQPNDEWLKCITGLLNSAQCLNLKYANIDWTCTPLQLISGDRYCCLFNKMQIKYRRHEKRIISFHKLQKVLAKTAPNLEHLKIPFDWSPRSVLLMCRLKQVTTLQLGQYMMLQGIQQEMIESLLRNMPQLKELELKICSPSHNNTTTYSINHPGLELLDISMCKGFFLQELKCPKLTVLKIGRYPWKGPVVNKETNKLQCIYSLCRRGTPRIAYINRHHIHAYWIEFLYDELNTVLSKYCSCKDHLYKAAAPVVPDPGLEENAENVGLGNGPMPVGIQGHVQQVVPQLGAALGLGPAVLGAIDPSLANIVPLFPLLQENVMPDDAKPSTSGESAAHAGEKERSRYVVDDALPSTSTDPRAQGKSCAKFKAKRSKSAPVPLENNDEVSDTEDQDIPIEHSTVEVRSTPRINTFPLYGAPTHVAVIPIRVIDPKMISVPPVLNPAPVAIQSIALQHQVIAVDKLTGTHVVSGPLTVVKHIIQVIPKTTPESPVNNACVKGDQMPTKTAVCGESIDQGVFVGPGESPLPNVNGINTLDSKPGSPVVSEKSANTKETMIADTVDKKSGDPGDKVDGSKSCRTNDEWGLPVIPGNTDENASESKSVLRKNTDSDISSEPADYIETDVIERANVTFD